MAKFIAIDWQGRKTECVNREHAQRVAGPNGKVVVTNPSKAAFNAEYRAARKQARKKGPEQDAVLAGAGLFGGMTTRARHAKYLKRAAEARRSGDKTQHEYQLELARAIRGRRAWERLPNPAPASQLSDAQLKEALDIEWNAARVRDKVSPYLVELSKEYQRRIAARLPNPSDLSRADLAFIQDCRRSGSEGIAQIYEEGYEDKSVAGVASDIIDDLERDYPGFSDHVYKLGAEEFAKAWVAGAKRIAIHYAEKEARYRNPSSGAKQRARDVRNPIHFRNPDTVRAKVQRILDAEAKRDDLAPRSIQEVKNYQWIEDAAYPQEVSEYAFKINADPKLSTVGREFLQIGLLVNQLSRGNGYLYYTPWGGQVRNPSSPETQQSAFALGQIAGKMGISAPMYDQKFQFLLKPFTSPGGSAHNTIMFAAWRDGNASTQVRNPKQVSLFGGGEDLPLFASAPRAKVAPLPKVPPKVPHVFVDSAEFQALGSKYYTLKDLADRLDKEKNRLYPHAYDTPENQAAYRKVDQDRSNAYLAAWKAREAMDMAQYGYLRNPSSGKAPKLVRHKPLK